MYACDNKHNMLEASSYFDTLNFEAVRGGRSPFCDAIPPFECAPRYVYHE